MKTKAGFEKDKVHVLGERLEEKVGGKGVGWEWVEGRNIKFFQGMNFQSECPSVLLFFETQFSVSTNLVNILF